MAAGFYVYEHVRRDTGAVFYVGKGSGYRLRVAQHRSRRWHAIVRKHGYDARIVFETEDEELAFLAEQELIDKHRRDGMALVNVTDGGGGMVGWHPSPETVAKRAEKQRGQCRPATSEKLRGRPKSADHRRKLSEARLGKKHTAATRELMSRQRQGRKLPMVTCNCCGRSLTVANAARWHMDNCREHA